MIQINIYNLAGIPSIIYGMLGLTMFVRTLGDLMGITSGAVFGVSDTNGRTILSAALTMALLILPLIIVNTQEAMRAVPSTLREAAYGIGLTKLQTIWHHVLPSALPGILTGAILAMSRAIGETAPLIVIGASTFIAVDPNGPFSKFTALPIQIYKWTSLPDETFLNVSAAAIVVLLAVLGFAQHERDSAAQSISANNYEHDRTRRASGRARHRKDQSDAGGRQRAFTPAFAPWHDVTLPFYERQITAIIGPSGCGKSTLLRSINRMNELVGGRVKGRLMVGRRGPVCAGC